MQDAAIQRLNEMINTDEAEEVEEEVIETESDGEQ